MSMVNTSIVKQSYKFMEIPLNKFHEEAVPHHERVFEVHKKTIEKLVRTKNVEQLQRELKNKKRIVRQLKDLLYELDTLRTQVEDSDLDRYDAKTLPLRKIILGLISNYSGLESHTTQFIQNQIEEVIDKNDNPLAGLMQIQIEGSLSDLKLKEAQQRLEHAETLCKDVEGVHEIFHDLNRIVVQQKEAVDVVETNVEVANDNVKGGLLQLIQASKYKKASYPVAGAFIGSLVGGPIGSLAGLKIGGLAAIGCGLVGYVSGRFIRTVDDKALSITEEITDLGTVSEKKDI